jgi:hypothetical protein
LAANATSRSFLVVPGLLQPVSTDAATIPTTTVIDGAAHFRLRQFTNRLHRVYLRCAINRECDRRPTSISLRWLNSERLPIRDESSLQVVACPAVDS